MDFSLFVYLFMGGEGRRDTSDVHGLLLALGSGVIPRGAQGTILSICRTGDQIQVSCMLSMPRDPCSVPLVPLVLILTNTGL